MVLDINALSDSEENPFKEHVLAVGHGALHELVWDNYSPNEISNTSEQVLRRYGIEDMLRSPLEINLYSLVNFKILYDEHSGDDKEKYLEDGELIAHALDSLWDGWSIPEEFMGILGYFLKLNPKNGNPSLNFVYPGEELYAEVDWLKGYIVSHRDFDMEECIQRELEYDLTNRIVYQEEHATDNIIYSLYDANDWISMVLSGEKKNGLVEEFVVKRFSNFIETGENHYSSNPPMTEEELKDFFPLLLYF